MLFTAQIKLFSHLDLGAPFFPGGHELWHHPLAYSAAAAAELPSTAALQHATLVHPALHPQVPVRSYLWLNPDKIMDQQMHQVSNFHVLYGYRYCLPTCSVKAELGRSVSSSIYRNMLLLSCLRPKWLYSIHQLYIHHLCIIWHPVIFYQARPWLAPLERISMRNSNTNNRRNQRIPRSPQMPHARPYS